MYRGEYKTVAPNGLPYYYAVGDTILYQGRIYEVINPTPKSPFQSPKDWKFVGISEPYQDASSPFEPLENQFWVDANKTLFIRSYTGTGYVWQSLSGSTTSGSGFTGLASQLTIGGTNSSNTFYPVFVDGTGNKSVYIDPSAGPLSYIPQTSTLKLTKIELNSGALLLDSNGIELTTVSNFYIISQELSQYGDGYSIYNGTNLEIDPPNNKIKIYNLDLTDTELGITGSINATSTGIFGGLVTSNIGLSGPNIMYARSVNIITESTTAGNSARTDYVYQGNSTGNITLTLPSATGNTNRYTIKNSNTGTFRIETLSSQTIDGITFYEIAKQYQSIDLISDNSNWFII